MSELGDAVKWAQENHPLPRCHHGSCLRDHGGDLLEPPCGCRLTTASVLASRALASSPAKVDKREEDFVKAAKRWCAAAAACDTDLDATNGKEMSDAYDAVQEAYSALTEAAGNTKGV